MRQLVFLLAPVLFPLLFRGQSANEIQATTLAFTHVTVLDMMGGPAQSNMTVVVTGNQITAVKKSQHMKVPKGTRVVDVKGKFMLPGLWDMHAHTLRPQGDSTDYLTLFVANGITGIRDLGNSSMSMTEVQLLRKEIERGKRPGPRLFVCGPLVDGKISGFRNKVIVTTEQEGRTVVDSLKKAGVDFIKVYSQLSPEVYFAISDEAKKQSIPFVGHVPIAVGAKEASNAGQRSMEHLSMILQSCSSSESQLRQDLLHILVNPGSSELRNKWNAYNQLLLNTQSGEKAKELFALFIRNNTWQCPTLTERYTYSHFEESSQANQDKFKYLSEGIKAFWSERTQFRKKNDTPTSIELLKKQYQMELHLVAAMNKEGVALLAGSDNGNPFIFPGFGLHDELELLVKAGLSPLQALQTATLNPAKYFGLTDSLGTVEKGKWADLLLLDANPLENIANTKKIAAVVANGRYFSKKALEQMLKESETAAGKQQK